MTSQNANESVFLQTEAIKGQIASFQSEQAAIQAQIKELLFCEDPAKGVSFHADIFRLQQEKLRLDTEIQFLNVRLRRLQCTW